MAADFALGGSVMLAARIYSIYHGVLMKSGIRPLGRALGALLRPAMRRRGFAVSEILTRWPLIVGDSLAQVVAPERVRYAYGNRPGAAEEPAVLQLRVAPGFATEVQHLEPLIVERINSYYGFRAVGRLKLTQGPLPAPAPKPDRRLRPLSPAEEERLGRLLGGVGDAELREALAQLGRGVAGRHPAGATSKS